MGEFDEDDLFDNQTCNLFEVYQNQVNQQERDNYSQMWNENFEVVYSQFRTVVE